MRVAGDVVRVAPWKGDPKVALVTSPPGRPPPLRDDLVRRLDDLAVAGYSVALTGPLERADEGPYLGAGFEEYARLHVLGRPLDDLPRRDYAVRLLRTRLRDRPDVHRVDQAAFSWFWQLGDSGMDDALAATPDARFRIARDGARICAYAICGQAGAHGYVQRLAVDPTSRRTGLARALVLDGLAWMRRHGARDALVNTQVDNDAALALYNGLGFRRRPSGLRVLRLALAPDAGEVIAGWTR